MRMAVSIEHPAWAHQFRYVIQQLRAEGNSVLALAVEKDGDTELLRDFGIDYQLMERSTGKNVPEKCWLFLKLCVTYSLAIRKNRVELLFGRASPMMAVAAFLCHIPHVVFEDTEVSKFSLLFCRLFSSCIITPEPFLTDLGKKQQRLPIYKELFYLGRGYFQPDPELLRGFGMDPDEPYMIARFVSWDASHDVGKKGLSDKEKADFVKRLSAFARVYVSSEGALPPALETYRLPTPYQQIHQALYFASLVVSEGASMASEAAVLGTHALYLNEIESGTTNEQEKRFGLLTVLHNPHTRYAQALSEAEKLLADSDLRAKGKRKREALLNAMSDANQAFIQALKERMSNGFPMEK